MGLKIIPRNKIQFNFDMLKEIASFLIRNSSSRKYVPKLEEEFRRYIKVNYAISISSARHGLYLILKTLNLKKGDQIILSSYNPPLILDVLRLFPANPIFVDVSEKSFTINPDIIKKKITSRTKAIIITHAEGFVCQMDQINQLVKKNKIIVIEDCAHAIGAEFYGKKVGSLGDFGFFSFSYMKHINAFGGGMITTNDKEYAGRINSLMTGSSNLSKKEILKRFIKGAFIYAFLNTFLFKIFIFPLLLLFSLFEKDIISNLFEEKQKKKNKSPLISKLSDFQAKIALTQLNKIDNLNNIRHNTYDWLRTSLDLTVQLPEKGTSSSYLNICFRIKGKEEFRRKLLKRGIDTQHTWLHNCDKSGKSPVAQRLEKEVFYLSPLLSKKEIDYIISELEILK